MPSHQSSSSSASSSKGVSSSSSRVASYTNAHGSGGYCEAEATSADGQTSTRREVFFGVKARSVQCTVRATASSQGTSTSSQIKFE